MHVQWVDIGIETICAMIPSICISKLIFSHCSMALRLWDPVDNWSKGRASSHGLGDPDPEIDCLSSTLHGAVLNSPGIY